MVSTPNFYIHHLIIYEEHVIEYRQTLNDNGRRDRLYTKVKELFFFLIQSEGKARDLYVGSEKGVFSLIIWGKIKAHKVRAMRWNGRKFRLVLGNVLTTNHMGIVLPAVAGGLSW
jgi:hypothetical protein